VVRVALIGGCVAVRLVELFYSYRSVYSMPEGYEVRSVTEPTSVQIRCLPTRQVVGAMGAFAGSEAPIVLGRGKHVVGEDERGLPAVILAAPRAGR
jgi:hypothetical protein